MTTTLTIDKAGRIVVPKAIREKLRFEPGSTLQAEVVGDRLELSLAPSPLRLVRKGKRRVVVGTGPFDAVAAVAEAREEYLSRLDSPSSK